MPALYRKRPVVIEATEYLPELLPDILRWTEGEAYWDTKRDALYVATLEGDMKVSVGDFIIRGVAGEFYPCKPAIFAETYEEVDEIDVALDYYAELMDASHLFTEDTEQ